MLVDGIERFLAENLKKAMANGGTFPLRPENLKESVLRDENFQQMVLFSMITDERVEGVISGLPEPEGALSSGERAKRLKKIDEEISNLESLLSKEAAAATREAVEED